MSAVCPACGVPVVAGYVKCPKCHAALPYGRGRAARAVDAGGTSLEGARGFPLAAVVVALLVAGGILAVFWAVGRGGKRDTAAAAPVAAPVAADPAVAQPTQPTQPAQAPAFAAPKLAPETVAGELQAALRKQKLWSTVTTKPGQLIEVRSRSCNEAQTGALVGNQTARLREAGLTQVRCVEESGAVVWQRAL